MTRALPVMSPRSGGAAIAVLAVILLVSACGLADTSSPVPATTAGTVEPSASEPASEAPSEAPSEPATAASSPSPSYVPPTAPPTPAPTPSPQPSASGPAPSGSPGAGAAAACFGSADTRDFFVAFAQSVSWPVYCVVLPTGWSVEKGTYYLRDGGRLTISYRRRSDSARIILDEGAICLTGAGCSPPGAAAGTAPFGDRTASLIDTGGGGFAAVVDVGLNPSWQLTGSNLSESDFRALAADLFLVDL